MADEVSISVCTYVPAGVVMPACFDGFCPACGRLLSEHEQITLALTGEDLEEESSS